MLNMVELKWLIKQLFRISYVVQFAMYVSLIWAVKTRDDTNVRNFLITLLVFHVIAIALKNNYSDNGVKWSVISISFFPLFGVLIWNIVQINDDSTFHGNTVYAAYTFIFVYNVVKMYGAYVMRTEGTKQKHIYRVRSTILTFVVSMCICIILYYTSVLSDFVSNNNNITWYSTTQFVNKSSCTPVLKEEALYATYDFTSDCAYYIWVRSRATLLATVQILIAFELVVRIPHYNNIFETERKHPLWFSAVITLMSQLLLFGGMTIWVNDIDRWYIMPLSTACMLTIHAVGMSIVMIIRNKEESDFVSYLLNTVKSLPNNGFKKVKSCLRTIRQVSPAGTGTGGVETRLRDSSDLYWRPPSEMRRR